MSFGRITRRDYDSLLKLHETPTRYYERRKLGNNTYSTLDPLTRIITVRYHNTDIMKLAPDGLIEIYMGGFGTITTRERIDAFVGPSWSVYQKDFVQYLCHNSRGSTAIDPRIHYILHPDGKLTEGSINEFV